MASVRIRKRELRGYAKEAGGYIAWTEWQVIQGRKIIARFEIESQAVEFFNRMTGEQHG